MAVLVEGISVIVRCDSIRERHEGGWDAFLRHIPNPTFCTDDELVRVGFMHPNDVEVYVTHLVGRGLAFLDDNDLAINIAVADQRNGLTSDCDWLEFGRISLKDVGGKVAACWLFEGPRIAAGIHMKGASFNLATPKGWVYERSLSKQFAFVPTEGSEERFRFLRSEGPLFTVGTTTRPPAPSGVETPTTGTAQLSTCISRPATRLDGCISMLLFLFMYLSRNESVEITNH